VPREDEMKERIKLWLRRWALRQLIKLADRAEERLQAWQVSLRNDLCGCKTVAETAASFSAKPVPARTCLTSGRGQPQGDLAAESNSQAGTRHRSPVDRPLPAGETFLEWEARKSGVIITDGCKTCGKSSQLKYLARRRRERLTAAAFDLRFAR
jgi:hypothetical protein